MRASVGL